ncbi:MAG: TRAM domain-containing protein, partial [Clostridia bacterium]|nr:TRAM domain-containing protein [Clostridia bacterium]
MNRRGNSETIRNVIRMCKERDISIRTTFIVGFPGETEEMFRELMDFVRETRFDKLGAFAYSPEEGTAAAVMPDQIPEEIKQQRYDRLMRLQQGISRENLRKRLGSVCEVLCEGRDKRGRFIGRSEFEAPEVDGLIHFTSEKSLKPGEYVNVRILAGKAYDLIGEAL